MCKTGFLHSVTFTSLVFFEFMIQKYHKRPWKLDIAKVQLSLSSLCGVVLSLGWHGFYSSINPGAEEAFTADGIDTNLWIFGLGASVVINGLT